MMEGQDLVHAEREPPKISIALNAFGGVSIVSSILFLAGSFYIENDIGKAFCLGAFFSGLLGSILLFGFAKVIDQLDAIRAQTESAAVGRGGHSRAAEGAGSEAGADPADTQA
jgi:hypothetical protein